MMLWIVALTAQPPTPAPTDAPPTAGMPLGGLVTAVLLIVLITLVQTVLAVRRRPPTDISQTNNDENDRNKER